MASKGLSMSMLVGVVSGWFVVMFQGPYSTLKNLALTKVRRSPFRIFLVELLMPLVGMLCLILIVMIFFGPD